MNKTELIIIVLAIAFSICVLAIGFAIRVVARMHENVKNREKKANEIIGLAYKILKESPDYTDDLPE